MYICCLGRFFVFLSTCICSILLFLAICLYAAFSSFAGLMEQGLVESVNNSKHKLITETSSTAHDEPGDTDSFVNIEYSDAPPSSSKTTRSDVTLSSELCSSNPNITETPEGNSSYSSNQSQSRQVLNGTNKHDNGEGSESLVNEPAAGDSIFGSGGKSSQVTSFMRSQLKSLSR